MVAPFSEVMDGSLNYYIFWQSFILRKVISLALCIFFIEISVVLRHFHLRSATNFK
jgi:hypothetical protein